MMEKQYSHGQPDELVYETYSALAAAKDKMINVSVAAGMAVSLGTITCVEESRTQPKCKIVHHLCLVPERLVDDGSGKDGGAE